LYSGNMLLRGRAAFDENCCINTQYDE